MNRYYLPELKSGQGIALDKDQAAHMSVAHDRPGDPVVLFDGSGRQATATITLLTRKNAVVDIGSVKEVSRELPVRIVLGTAMPKAQRQHLVVEKTTELGVYESYPLRCSRSVVKPGKSSKREKFDQFAIEACKQCGRNLLPTVHPMMEFDRFVRDVPSEKDLKVILSTAGSAAPLREILLPWRGECGDGGAGRIVAAVGPEGGFTDQELALAADHGFHAVTLGPAVLRIETACMALLAQVAALAT